MFKNFDTLLERILDLPIRDVVEKYSGQQLKKKGANYTMACPFCGQGKTTASFFVNERRNICKCFSCEEGGNTLSFVMKQFNLSTGEAIKRIADDYGIPYEIEKEERTKEQEADYKKRDAAYILLENVTRLYAQKLKETPEKIEYVKSRWGEENSQTVQFGYASESWNELLKYAQANAWNLRLMEELGLIKKDEKGRFRDVFRNRIIIPIEDRRGRVIAFTARNVGPDTYTIEENGIQIEKSIAKYINSPESFIYTKGENLYGYYLMKHAKCDHRRVYLVEGAPDVLSINNIKIYNVVAPLGTALTEAQMRMMKMDGIKEICFIPDQDIIKPGETEGVGMKNAIKNAIQCIKKGFAVSIKIIPTEKGKKEDPGSFFTSKGRFDELKEEDFILFYADRIFDGAKTIIDKDNAMKKIAGILKEVESDSVKETYISRLTHFHGKIKAWREAISECRKEEVQKSSSKTGKSELTSYQKYNFIEDGNKIFSLDEQGNQVQWSNFSMRPLFHIKDNVNPKRMYSIKNCFGYEQIIEMKQEELTSMSKFKTKTEGLGNFIWEAGERELIKLKKYLYEQTETATEVIQLGWQKNGNFFAFGNGAFNGSEFIKVDDYGIVKLQKGNFYLPAFSKIFRDDESLYQFERRFIHEGLGEISLYDYSKKMIEVYKDNAKIGLCFLFATLFKDVIVRITKSFPILNLFGPKGAGKSEMGHSLMSFFVIKNTPLNITNSTIPAMGDAVAQVANALVHLDEFKNNIDIDRREFLKGLWDGTGRNRMNMDKDKKRETTKVDSGVIVSGQEMATADIALFSRFIFLCFTQTKYSDLEKARFQELKEIESRGLSHLTLQLLALRGEMINHFHENYNEASRELSDELKENNVRVEDRIFRNWLTLLAVFRTIHSHISLPFHYVDLREIFVKLIIRQNKECENNNELSEFWSIISFLNQSREIYLNADFRICTENILKLKNGKEIIPQKPTEYLYLRKDRLFQLYQNQARNGGSEKPLNKNSLIFYLQNSPEYVGEKTTVRFKNIIRGIEERADDINGKTVKTSNLSQAMIFDYALVKKHYEIDLDVYGEEDMDTPTFTAPIIKEKKDDMPF